MECESQNIPIGKAIVFGSYISGKSHRYSDFDVAVAVAVVSDKFSEDPINNSRLIRNANLKFQK